MTAVNTGKPYTFTNATLYADDASNQDLNTDLQKNLADEQDLMWLTAVGGDGVFGSGAFQASAGSAFLVNLAAGVAFVQGQILKATGTTAVDLVSDGTYEVYIQAGTPFSNTLHAWPVSGGKAAGTPAGAMKICTVVCSSSGASKVITDARTVLVDTKTMGTRLPTTSEKSALAGTSGSPGAGNEYVTKNDPKISLSRIAAYGVL